MQRSEIGKHASKCMRWRRRPDATVPPWDGHVAVRHSRAAVKVYAPVPVPVPVRLRIA
jgi:hypothetical protein